MICPGSTRSVCCPSRAKVAQYCQTCLPAAHALRFTPNFTRPSHHRRQFLHPRYPKPKSKCYATKNPSEGAQNGQDDAVQHTSRLFQSFIQRQVSVALGALLLAVLLIRPLAKQWSAAHKPVPDALPAAVWLPRPTSGQLAKQRADCHNNKQAKTFAAISSSIPATSSRLLRISDAFLMQLTVALQQVKDNMCIPCLHSQTLP